MILKSVSKAVFSMIRDKRGISPVITTVILVAVGIAVAIAVALWMSGLIGIFTRLEMIQIRNAYASRVGSNFVTFISLVNTGSSDTSIDTLLINGKLHTAWTTATPNVTLPMAAKVGVPVNFQITMTDPTTEAGGSRLVSGVTVTFSLHSTGGKEYSTSVTLP